MSAAQCFLIVIFTCAVYTGHAIRCSVCEWKYPSGRDTCIKHPPSPVECPDPQHNACITLWQSDREDNIIYFSRNCVPTTLPYKDCVPWKDQATDESNTVCYKTCSFSGCNGASPLHHMLNFVGKKK